MYRKIFVFIACFALAGARFAAEAQSVRIGVCMPTRSLQRWNQDGDNLRRLLEEHGYAVDLQYADNDPGMQVTQVENMVAGGCRVLVIAPIDTTAALRSALNSARRARIPVIAYDRLIMGTSAVSYYTSFDNAKVGEMQATYLVERLDLENRTASDPAYIECFTGPISDDNVRYFFDSAMDMLQPYFDSGALVCRSGETTLAQCQTPNWQTDDAQQRMTRLISSQGYGSRAVRLDGVLCSNDSTALGVENALSAAGYSAQNFPVVTGQDCDITSVRNMLRGLQAMSVFKDTRVLAEATADMVASIVEGRRPLLNDTSTYNNGTGVIPAYICEPVVVTPSNYEEVLLGSGYYTRDDLD